MSLRAVELFGGAGGLALGTHAAGFANELFVEWDRWACDTVRQNRKAGHSAVQGWDVREGDVRKVDFSVVPDGLDLVTGGPPCQPFSMGGKARASDDKRDMFPAAAEVVRTLRPRAFLLENVRGLKRAAFSDYFEFIRLRMQYPELVANDNESWLDHFRRLQREHIAGQHDSLTYNVADTLVNAADYGVPQHRHRVFIVGFRADIDTEWAFPQPTHSHDALLEAQWVTGNYWDEHSVPTKERPLLPSRFESRIRKIRDGQIEVNGRLPWRTVRDALNGMPEPLAGGVAGWKNHNHQPGARAYPGHTGSPLDEPSKALKAGGHGVPGGENMLRRVDGSVRYYSIREAARIQTFPDDYELHGAWGEAMRQLGNAVPVLLAKTVGAAVAGHLNSARMRDEAVLQAS
ncbi:DNA (cytosine-5-)-methyltransferase [Arthrobacter sp. zg-Y1143]|uniref:DNA cytosine methyltransferase n=1 Tax=Arthrobacter sp. zg-Y1143 TaxID=3049065 RepID=UPI0024C244AC|nr:DNA (cytosine-5-)-methyltransferase [Arthrobacter sp. zg-Y1143]MDK1328262.1 DNA (cytosine-5-)-methyltransferase [Arthrobacter sp. zg-Y1143]